MIDLILQSSQLKNWRKTSRDPSLRWKSQKVWSLFSMLFKLIADCAAVCETLRRLLLCWISQPLPCLLAEALFFLKSARLAFYSNSFSSFFFLLPRCRQQSRTLAVFQLSCAVQQYAWGKIGEASAVAQVCYFHVSKSFLRSFFFFRSPPSHRSVLRVTPATIKVLQICNPAFQLTT